MRTYILTLDESQEAVILALAKVLKMDLHLINESDEDYALLKAMEEGKKDGRLSGEDSKSFMDILGT